MKAKNNKFIYLFLLIVTVYLFNVFAYEIESFNARLRNFVATGNVEIRSFNDKGLPISSNPNIKGKFISPFYVVHYGLIYSELYNDNRDEFHWREDSSIEFWNIPPKENKKDFFKNSANWLIENLDYSFGEAHFIYNFDWNYKGYPEGVLRKPWWSGLTDAYAIVIMLRAYDVFKDEKYINAAEALYKSSIKGVKENGSLTYLNDYKWIEEYVDNKANTNEMAYVLNGMIYSTFGIKAYEDKFEIEERQTEDLLKSIEENISKFDEGEKWSNYDLIGTSCNMKYHKIHVALMSEMFKISKSQKFKIKENQWDKGLNNIGYNWIKNSKTGYAKLMYLGELFLIVVFFVFFMFRKNKFKC